MVEISEKKIKIYFIHCSANDEEMKVMGNKTEEELISLDNDRVDDDLKVKSLKDKRLGNPLHFINIMKSI